MPTEKVLQLFEFDPKDLTPIPTGFAAVDIPNHEIRISEDDVPTDNGGRLELTVLTIFVKASATDTALVGILATALQGASDGIAEVVLNDETIITNYSATLKAASELQFRTQSNFQLSFSTKINGFEPGQQLRFIDEVAGINILLIVQSVNSTLIGTVNAVDEFKHDIVAAPYIIDTMGLIARTIELSTFPRRKNGVEIGPPED